MTYDPSENPRYIGGEGTDYPDPDDPAQLAARAQELEKVLKFYNSARWKAFEVEIRERVVVEMSSLARRGMDIAETEFMRGRISALHQIASRREDADRELDQVREELKEAQDNE